MALTDSTAVETSTNVPNSPDRRRRHGQPFAMRAATARRCSKRASRLALGANLVLKTPTTGEDVVLRRAIAAPEIETPKPSPGARPRPDCVKQHGAAMNAEKPQQPRRKSDLKFFDLFVGITPAFQPRRLMIASAADGCKRWLGRAFTFTSIFD